MNEQKKALVAMSGGVDSAVTAYLVKQMGYDVLGVTMLLHKGGSDTCGALREAEDAARVAAALGIPHEVCDLSDRFEETVIRPFIEAYESGRTPNPCVACNRYLKFEALYRYGQARGCDMIATGHYARIARTAAGDCRLLTAADPKKDQSYVLYNLTREQLSHTLFPLGEMTKEAVRAHAARLGLPCAEKKESQDICFVPDGDYARFIEERTGRDYPCGEFVTQDGRVLGQHRGIIRYTVGQRKGLGLALPAPLYVCEIQPQKNRVVLGEEQALFSDSLLAEDVNLLRVTDWRMPQRVTARVRYHQAAQPATATLTEDGQLHVVFDSPLRAITRGQAVVLYEGDEVLGGGVIV